MPSTPPPPRPSLGGTHPHRPWSARPSGGEPRWPATLAVLAAIVIQYALPDKLVPGPRYLIPALAAPLLIALVIANPRRYHRGSRDLRWLSITLIAVINAANAASLVLLGLYLLSGGKADGRTVIYAAIGVWLTNVIVFALWFWEIDRGVDQRPAVGLPAGQQVAHQQHQRGGVGGVDDRDQRDRQPAQVPGAAVVAPGVGDDQRDEQRRRQRGDQVPRPGHQLVRQRVLDDDRGEDRQGGRPAGLSPAGPGRPRPVRVGAAQRRPWRRWRTRHGSPPFAGTPGRGGRPRRVVPRPRHLRGDDPMLGAAHPRRVGLQERPDQAQVQRSPPSAARTLVITGAALPAATTPALGRLPGPHRHHDGLLGLVELDVLHDDLHQPEQPSP